MKEKTGIEGQIDAVRELRRLVDSSPIGAIRKALGSREPEKALRKILMPDAALAKFEGATATRLTKAQRDGVRKAVEAAAEAEIAKAIPTWTAKIEKIDSGLRLLEARLRERLAMVHKAVDDTFAPLWDQIRELEIDLECVEMQPGPVGHPVRPRPS
ncbi:MAG: hypothetical protein ACREAA_07120 [Candidatus Polarisedimenticolia bacterium]